MQIFCRSAPPTLPMHLPAPCMFHAGTWAEQGTAPEQSYITSRSLHHLTRSLCELGCVTSRFLRHLTLSTSPHALCVWGAASPHALCAHWAAVVTRVPCRRGSGTPKQSRRSCLLWLSPSPPRRWIWSRRWVRGAWDGAGCEQSWCVNMRARCCCA